MQQQPLGDPSTIGDLWPRIASLRSRWTWPAANWQTLRRYRAKSEARQTLEAALAGFTALGAAPFAAIAEAEVWWGRRPATDGVLTPAEQRVADLVETGMTNREIAAKLFTSVRTVEGHLASCIGSLMCGLGVG